jgi:RimJ/RimL family protein N-acetyltransferase
VLAIALADPDVMRYIGDGRTRSDEEAVRWIEGDCRSWDLDGFGKFMVVVRNDERIIGRVGLSANTRSQAVAQRLGERHERDIVTANGHPAHLWRTS